MTFTAGPASAAQQTEAFTFTGAVQQWTVPAGVTSIHVVADGAQGGQDGGLGARVESDLTVAPGQVLDIYAGGAGERATGGFNGGGAGRDIQGLAFSGGGGGASDIRPSGGGAADRLLVAAGGGGSSGGFPSGQPVAGGAAGAAGADGTDGAPSPRGGVPPTGGQGGEPGTATAGGAGGAGGTGEGFSGNNGSDGSLAAGGAGAQPSGLVNVTGHDGGGGGGAGLYGGGGGGSGAQGGDGVTFSGGGGGGGGSSLDPDGGAAPTAAPAGNGQVTITYEAATYAFTGFFAPVDNPPVVNEVNAGRTVPVKFSLGGDQGLDILAPNSPSSQQVACNSSAPVDTVESTTSQSGLTYNSSTDQYQYNWKTQKAWSGTCR
ncbi:PxKF domain-containing protein, partial [Streptomyces sp. NPDC001774]